MKVALNLMAIAILVAACGPTTAGPTQAQASPSPQRVGTATLSETECVFEMPDRLPLRAVSFSLVNKTKYTGRFILSNIHQGHSYNDLIDYWNSPMGQMVAPTFITEIRLIDVPAKSSGEMVTPVTQQGTYAFHCGYADESNKVTAFFHELSAG